MHLVEVNGARLLLDCGLMQGKRKEAFERNRRLPFEAASIDKVVLSHAHIDHSGNLPSLVRAGFRGEIMATPATTALCDVMLRDSAYLQVKDVEYVNKKRAKQGQNLFEPLYTPADVDETMRHFRAVPPNTPTEAAPGVTVTFHNAGHLLGAALTTIDARLNGGIKRLLFTGDLGQKGMPILRDPDPVPDAVALVIESTYGNRLHPPKADVQGRLKGFIDDITQQKAKLIIPSFSVGRTQQIVFYLNEIYRQGRIRGVPVFVDSPLSSRATEVYGRFTQCYNEDALAVMANGNSPFHFRNLTYVTETEESKKLNDLRGPAIIISASGMCEGGRILHHLKNGISDPRNIVLFVGYQAQNTLGRRIVEGQSPVRIYGEEYEVNARIHTINALSAHADRAGLLEYFDAVRASVTRAFLVHGEDESCEALAVAFRERNAGEIIVPSRGATHAAF